MNAAQLANELDRFRWAACQLDVLSGCLSLGKLRQTLDSLPKTLDETYDRILCQIDPLFTREVLHILQWLTCSLRPLSLDEVAETVAFDVDSDHKFNVENRLAEPEDVLNMCSSLVINIETNSDDEGVFELDNHGIILEQDSDDGQRDNEADTIRTVSTSRARVMVRLAHFSGGAVVEGGGVGRCDCSAVFDECGFEGGDFFFSEIVVAFVPVDDCLAFFPFYRDGCNLVGERALFPRLLRAVETADRVLVLLLSRDVVFLGGFFGANTHVELVVYIPQPILDQSILHANVPEWRMLIGSRYVIWHTAHILHPACNLRFRKTQLYVLRGKYHRLQARGTYFVDGDRVHGR